MSVTGNLGKVMKESVTIAMEYLKSHANDFKLSSDIFDKWNVIFMFLKELLLRMGLQLVSLCLLLVSLFTQRKVKDKIAMTENQY